MAEYLTFAEIAERLGVSDRTVRRAVQKVAKDLEITVVRRTTPTSKGAKVNSLCVDDANKLFSCFEEKDRIITSGDESLSSFQRYGHFYIIQLVPEAMPNRVKLGYTDNLETRLAEHQTAAPTARYLGTWECKRSWEQAVIDSITRKNCELVMNEVYEGDIEDILRGAEDFFKLMPKGDYKIPLSNHSPLKTED